MLAGVLALAATAGPRARAGQAGADSVSVHAEAGLTVDASNELFYEDASTDTTFLGRRLYGTPDTRAAGVALLRVDGSAAGGRLTFGAHPEVTLGDGVSRATGDLALRWKPDDAWRFAFEPRAELSHDQRFGLDRRESLAGVVGRVRRRISAAGDALEARASGEWLGTPGGGDPYLLAHRTSEAGIRWDHPSPLGWDASVGASGVRRVYADSTTRNHQALRADAVVHRDVGALSLDVDGDGERRVTLADVPGSRDRFLDLRARVRGELRVGERHALVLAAEHEARVFDAPDSTLDFDYAVDRVALAVRRELAPGLDVELGPRAEWASTDWNPSERYAEVAGAGTLEWLGDSHWWLVTPAVGWRGYDAHAIVPGGGTPHSSYAFADLQLLAEQPLPQRLRLRLVGAARGERHIDRSQDSASLYFSLDLRRLF